MPSIELTITLVANLIGEWKWPVIKNQYGSPLDFPVLVNGTVIYPVSQNRKDIVVIFSLSLSLNPAPIKPLFHPFSLLNTVDPWTAQVWITWVLFPYGYFPIINTAVLHNPQLVESSRRTPDKGGKQLMRGTRIQRVNYTRIMDATDGLHP